MFNKESKPTKQIKIGNDYVNVKEVDVISCNENWNTYLLEDGTVLKHKTIVKQVFKVENRVDDYGNPVYITTSTNIMTVSCTQD